METNEAPEKIYLALNAFGDIIKNQWQFHRLSNDDIEYVRKEAFIEKACSYIRLYSSLLDTENNDCMPEWLDKFRNAMKK